MRVFAVFIFVALAGCATSPGPSNVGASLVGVWCASDDGGKTCYGYDQFYPNGKMDACGVLPNLDTGEPEPFAARGSYDVMGEVLCQNVEHVAPGMALRPGDRLCSRILSIGDREYVYKDQKSGDVGRYYGFAGDKPCEASIGQLVR